VRRPGDGVPAPATPTKPKKTTTADAPAPHHDEPAQPRGRWAMWVVLPLLFVAIAGAGAGYIVIRSIWGEQEDKLHAEADENYDKELFAAARDKYATLHKNFPDSDLADYYALRKDLSDIRNTISEKPNDPAPPIDQMDQLITDFEKSPLLPDHAGHLGKALVKLMVDFVDRAVAEPELAANSKAFEKADAVVKRLKKIKTKETVPLAEIARAAKKLDDAIKLATERKKFLDELERLADKPSYDSLVLIDQMRQEEAAKFPGVDGKIDDLIAKVKDGQLKKVDQSYTRDAAPAGKMALAEDEAAILSDCLLLGNPGNAPRNGPIVMALGRGVLYGLNQANGQARWAMRVGIDTTALPVRVPAAPGISERILVLSSDNHTLTAVDTAGHTLWRYRLDGEVLGRPVVVGNRAYLGTYKGDVHEIELSEGRRVGRFKLGHRLTLGGVHEPGSNRVYFAAHDGCVYVLRVGTQNPGCEAILYSNHPAGSLRGEPLIVKPEGKDTPGYLVLTQTEAPGGVVLRAFKLPITATTKPLDVEPAPRLNGWTWFPPYHDPEKVVMLTDTGILGVFGLKQPGLRDKALVPLLPEGGLKLAALGRAGDNAEGPARAAVMQVAGNDLWVLGLNRLQRLRRVWELDKGPELVPVWKAAPEVGSPLHAGQDFVDGQGRGRLVAVTRPQGKPACWATCVDDTSGKVLWQRQLGLVAHGEPVPLKMPIGPPLWLVQDQGGALFALDPVALVPRKGAQWVPARFDAPLAGPLDDNPRVPPTFLTAADGSVYVVACPGRNQKKVVVRHVKAGAGRTAVVDEREVELDATLAGPPALMGDRIVMALADGLCALLMPKANTAEMGAVDWRSERLGREVPGYVVAVGGDRFVTSDGGRGLGVWEWAPPKPQQAVPPTREYLMLPARIVAAPVLLPGTPTRLAVAHEGGLSLVEVMKDGSLVARPPLDVGGTPTSRPFVRETPEGPRLGVIVGGKRLVWIKPTKEKLVSLWDYTTKGPIVGEPHLAGGVLVVADLSGKYVGLSLAKGETVGKGHALRGSIAPASGAVPFQADRLLAPLTDGTLMLLRAEKFVEEKKKEKKEKKPKEEKKP
jgi:outer membrane protein assembly factor BamB